MRLVDCYPIIMTDKLTDCRDFYVGRLGFSVAFEASWFVYLVSDGATGIAFMASDHPSRPPGEETFGGQGLLLTLQVEDAAAAYDRIVASGATIHHPLTDEAWGQRRFLLRDPAGTWVDVVQQIAPAEGFWEQYAPAA